MAAVPAVSNPDAFFKGAAFRFPDSKFVSLTSASAASRNRPLLAPLVVRRGLNKVGSQKTTTHYTFLLNPSTKYEPGDSLGVYPLQSGELVESTIKALGLDPESAVSHRRVQSGAPVPLRELLTQHLDLRTVPPALARLSSDPWLTKLRETDKKEFNKYLQSVEIHDFVSKHLKGAKRDEIVQALKPLQPRLYSISSNQAVAGNTVDLTVAKVDYKTHGVERHGAATHFMYNIPLGQAAPVFVQRAPKFRPPPSTTPTIMVGPGTGIAPFRSFMQDPKRLQEGAKNWLFFGDQRPSDYLYGEEWERLQQTGKLRVNTAFSRDSGKKVYVQDRIRENGADVWEWLSKGAASVYICGDAKAMAPGVEKALCDVFEKYGGMDAKSAKEYLKSLEKAGRFHKDVY
eukprot:Sspe_Gene.110928::Locus_92064_Transcript_1_1_Confidence_1.000_Length_1405::g.110928::m.110928/K00380/cysJ; sulfite reductase (NADPH) flavoprotein alpha-component